MSADRNTAGQFISVQDPTLTPEERSNVEVQSHMKWRTIYVPHELDDSTIDVYAMRTFMALSRRAAKTNNAFESLPNMARRIGMSVRRLRMALRTLEEVNMIWREERPGRSSVYHIKSQEEWRLASLPPHHPGT